MSYIGNIPLPQATEARVEVTATSGQTSFTGLTYVENFLDVYLNGVKLASSDFTATNGNSCTLTSGAAAGDIVAFFSRTQTSALVALPLKDSTGANVLSESGGTVTLAHDTIFGTTTYGFAQLSRTSGASLGDITFNISGDTTNITKPSANHIIQLGISGIYLICCTASLYLSGEERYVELSLYKGDGSIEYATSYDSIKQADSGFTYGGTSISFVGSFAANSQIYFTCNSSNQADATLHDSVHASIVLLRRTS